MIARYGSLIPWYPGQMSGNIYDCAESALFRNELCIVYVACVCVCEYVSTVSVSVLPPGLSS